MSADLPANLPHYSTYTNVIVDVLRNVSGGNRSATNTIHFAQAGVVFDLSDNLRGTASIIINDDTQFTSPVGDDQIVSNIEAGFQGIRLNEAWLEWYADSYGLLAGVYDFNSEFDALESANLFINSAYGIGNDIGLSGANGPSIFPVTGLAIRLKWQHLAHSVKVAVLDGQPGDLNDLASFDLSLSSEQGAMLAAEYRYAADHQTWLFGYWQYTKSKPLHTSSEQADSGNYGYYFRGEFEASQVTGITDSYLFFRIGRAAPRFNKYEWFYSGGVTMPSPLNNREQDSIGIAFSTVEVGERQANQMLDNNEWNAEVSYRAIINEWFAVQPHVQWVGRPAARTDADDAWVAGVRFDINLP